LSGLFQDIITILNKYTKSPTNWQGGIPPSNTIAYEKTRIANVMWKDNVHTAQVTDGKPFIGKSVSITIPLDEMEADKTYAKPEEFIADTNVWTLNLGDIIVLGECEREITSSYTITNLQKDFRTIEVKAISDSTDQDILPSWKIEGV